MRAGSRDRNSCVSVCSLDVEQKRLIGYCVGGPTRVMHSGAAVISVFELTLAILMFDLPSRMNIDM